jgi:hypothetical protein
MNNIEPSITSEPSIKEQQILGQNSYNCTFQPGFDCKGNINNEEEYISKIQINKLTLDNEINISNTIKIITNYEDYFSPIIDYCIVDINSLETKEIEKCEILSNSELDTKIKIS